MGIDDLWDVGDIRHVKPSWHGFGSGARQADDKMALVPAGKRGKSAGGKRKPLAIMDRDGDESDGSMPSLQTVSESDEEDDYTDDDDDDDDRYSNFDDDSEGDSEDDYDTDEEDELRDLLREAMDAAVASGDFFESKANPAPSFDALAEERKGNPFLKLLGSLRGLSSSLCLIDEAN